MDVKEARLWLADARSDLALAMSRKTRAMRYSHLCFHAQQAAEKALKAVLIANKVSVPKTHDLAYLVNMLPSAITAIPAIVQLPVLTKYAVLYRYPGQDLPVTKRDHENSVRLAKEIVVWSGRVILGKRRA